MLVVVGYQVRGCGDISTGSVLLPGWETGETCVGHEAKNLLVIPYDQLGIFTGDATAR